MVSYIDYIKYLNDLVVLQSPNSPSKNWKFIVLHFNQCVNSIEISYGAHCSFVFGIN